MNAYNQSRDRLLASDVVEARSLWRRTRGLLGCSEEKFRAGQGMWLAPCQGIHTIGMAFPIDVAYLDRNGTILRVYHRLAPFRIGALVLRAKGVLELPPGTLKATGTCVGDVLRMEPVDETQR